MTLKFFAYIEGPGGEFLDPGCIDSPVFEEMTLYPVFYEVPPFVIEGSENPSEYCPLENLWWIFPKGEDTMFVAPVQFCPHVGEYDFLVDDESFWIDREGNATYGGEPTFVRANLKTSILEAWDEIKARCK